MNNIFGYPLDNSLRVNARNYGIGLTQQLVSATQFIVMFQLGRRLSDDACVQGQNFVISGRSLESHVHARDNKEQSQFFHFSVVAALRAKQFCATDLEIR